MKVDTETSVQKEAKDATPSDLLVTDQTPLAEKNEKAEEIGISGNSTALTSPKDETVTPKPEIKDDFDNAAGNPTDMDSKTAEELKEMT